ncbi:protein AMBP-like [Clupea harengus]|uniref:Protein AMBP n=1 Tax=Clupea harengus TaxID=7950 RepID=A0A6P3W540_CLUHA|nr:protein AMBP-like [Clupea harengus]
MEAAALVILLVALVVPLHAGPLPSEPLLPTQESFDLDRFMGKWYDVAKASTCPWMQKHKENSPIGTWQLEKGPTADTVSMSRTMSRHGTCKQISGDYHLTETPGRFKYHVSRWNADVDAYVMHTNYDEYALVVMIKQKQGGDKSTSVKLYGRTPELRDTLVEDFKRVVREQGMSEDTIVIKQNKGECIPGETVVVDIPIVQRSRRAAVLPQDQDDEGSGMMATNTPLFWGPEVCEAAPDSGPCFGMSQRFHYNTSLKACQVFNFGGCLGNQNNFVTEKECLQSCRTEAACRMPIDAGSCNTHVELWAFDSKAGKCVSFKYRGCQGNGNKFYSQKECEEYCGVMKDDDKELFRAN